MILGILFDLGILSKKVVAGEVLEDSYKHKDPDLYVFECQKQDDRGYSVKTDLMFFDDKKRSRFYMYIQDIERL